MVLIKGACHPRVLWDWHCAVQWRVCQCEPLQGTNNPTCSERKPEANFKEEHGWVSVFLWILLFHRWKHCSQESLAQNKRALLSNNYLCMLNIKFLGENLKRLPHRHFLKGFELNFQWNFTNLRSYDLRTNYVSSNAPLFNFHPLRWNLTLRNANRKGWERCLPAQEPWRHICLINMPSHGVLGSLADVTLLTLYTMSLCPQMLN